MKAYEVLSWGDGTNALVRVAADAKRAFLVFRGFRVRLVENNTVFEYTVALKETKKLATFLVCVTNPHCTEKHTVESRLANAPASAFPSFYAAKDARDAVLLPPGDDLDTRLALFSAQVAARCAPLAALPVSPMSELLTRAPRAEATDFCGARRNVKGNRYNLFPAHQGTVGFGLSAGKFIPAHAYFVRYTGEIISVREEDRRERRRRYRGDTRSYTMVLPDKSARIDALRTGGLGRYANHSCAPNSVFIEDTESEVWIVALSDIGPGEFITVNYGWQDEAGCQCGAPGCTSTFAAPEEAANLADCPRQLVAPPPPPRRAAVKQRADRTASAPHRAAVRAAVRDFLRQAVYIGTIAGKRLHESESTHVPKADVLKAYNRRRTAIQLTATSFGRFVSVVFGGNKVAYTTSNARVGPGGKQVHTMRFGPLGALRVFFSL
jgi:hypothetical protein